MNCGVLSTIRGLHPLGARSPLPQPSQPKITPVVGKCPRGTNSLYLRTSVLPSVKYLHIKYVSCLGVWRLLEAIHVHPSQPWLWQLSHSPHVPLIQVTVGCGSLQPSVTGHSSSHESRGSRYISGSQTALTCSEAGCSWPSGFQTLWPQNATYQGALLLESSGVCLPLGPVCREHVVSGEVFSNLSSPSFFVGSSVYDCSCFSTLAVVYVIQRFTTL